MTGRAAIAARMATIVPRPEEAPRRTSRGFKMPGEDVGPVDPIVGEEAIGGLGVRPILAGKRHAIAHRPSICSANLRRRLFTRPSER
jgi:hypothetical protein